MAKYLKFLLIIAVLSILLHAAAFVQAEEADSNLPQNILNISEPLKISYEKARILEVEETTQKIEGEEGVRYETLQRVKIKILSGKYRGEEKILENTVSTNPLDLSLKKENKILVYIEEHENGSVVFQVQDYWRLNILIWFIIIFLLILLLLGGRQGLKIILSLTVAIILIFKILIPQVLIGGNPIRLALVISIIITIITLILVSGLRRKSIAAILGTIGGLLVATVLAIFVGRIANLTGTSSEESRILLIEFPNLNLQGLLFGSVIIGALGAVMDIGMSIASSVTEVKKTYPYARMQELIKSGLTVGRDVMGTMVNTLIFAYVGVSLPLLLLFTKYGGSYLKFLNFEFVAEEVVRSIAGSIGLVAAIPLTAIIAGYLEGAKRETKNKK